MAGQKEAEPRGEGVGEEKKLTMDYRSYHRFKGKETQEGQTAVLEHTVQGPEKVKRGPFNLMQLSVTPFGSLSFKFSLGSICLRGAEAQLR